MQLAWRGWWSNGGLCAHSVLHLIHLSSLRAHERRELSQRYHGEIHPHLVPFPPSPHMGDLGCVNSVRVCACVCSLVCQGRMLKATAIVQEWARESLLICLGLGCPSSLGFVILWVCPPNSDRRTEPPGSRRSSRHQKAKQSTMACQESARCAGSIEIIMCLTFSAKKTVRPLNTPPERNW